MAAESPPPDHHPHLPPGGGVALVRDAPFASRAEVRAAVRASAAEPAAERVRVPLSPPASPERAKRRPRAPRADDSANPLAHSVARDEFEADKVASYEALRAANQRLNRRLRPYYEQRCQTDMLYAFLYGYDECGMDESLATMVEYVLKQYALDADAPAPYGSDQAAVFVRETFAHIVERSRDRTAKLALMLFILAREPRVEARVRAECPAATVRHLDQFMRALRYLTRATLQAKCTRQNVQTLLQTFVVRCGATYIDELMPAGLDPHTADVTPTYHTTTTTTTTTAAAPPPPPSPPSQ